MRYVSLWILQLVSLRCFQQKYHRRLLKLIQYVIPYDLTIDSDAALVSNTFQICHSLIFESRWLLSVLPCGELGTFLLRAYLHLIALGSSSEE